MENKCNSTCEEKRKLFSSLLASVSHCNICERMGGRKKVLSNLNGSINSKVLFIAEAPGRLGAECTGIPLYGDRTGDNFQLLLSNIGWERKDIFITNSILCNPQDEKGNNSTPDKKEVENCSMYLLMTLNLINPDVVVTLGVKALESLKYIEHHNYVLKEDVGQSLRWNGRKIFPLYHMGPRALIHRNLTKQRSDFIKLSHLVDPEKGLKREKSKKTSNTNLLESTNKIVIEALRYIVSQYETISMFKAMKLLYLADFRALQSTGDTITNSIYLRMKHGPWIPSLKNIAIELDKKKLLTTEFEGKKAYYVSQTDNYIPNLDSEKIELLNEIITRYRDSDDSHIRSVVYLTEPMKYILRAEKQGRSMAKIPVIYNNQTVIDIDSSETTKKELVGV